jgi:hypothetical protein
MTASWQPCRETIIFSPISTSESGARHGEKRVHKNTHQRVCVPAVQVTRRSPRTSTLTPSNPDSSYRLGKHLTAQKHPNLSSFP